MTFAIEALTGRAPGEPPSWRAGLLRSMLRIFAILGAVAYLPSLWLSIREQLWAVAAVDTLVYAFILYLHFSPRRSYWFTVNSLLSVTFVLGVVLLITVGPFGAGELWLFAFPVLAGVLAGVRAALVALALNLVTLLGIGFSLGTLAATAPAWTDRTRAGWTVVALNFMLLDAAITMVLTMLVARLDHALAGVQEGSAKLDAERQELLRANERLRLEIAERQAAEQRHAELEKQLLHAQKLEAVGRLAGGIAHDFNNLLTAVLGYADILEQKLRGQAAFHEEINEIRRAAGRAADLTRQLLAFGRKQVLQTQVLSLSASVRETERMLRRIIGENVELETVIGSETGRVCADPGQLEQVIVNLSINARDAMPRGGKLTLRTADVTLEEAEAARLGVKAGEYVELSVIDTGAGMDAVTLNRIFEPFFTTKEVGRGTGLGLATVYGIVRQSGGQIVAESEVGQGSRFRILLPRIEGEGTKAPAAKAPVESSQRGSETILLVEDEDNVRRLARTILEQRGYRVLAAESGAAALELARDRSQTIHLLLSDLVMPGMSGNELLDRIRRDRPQVRALYMTGYIDEALARASGVVGAVLIQKPFQSADLARRVRETLDDEGVGAAPGARTGFGG